MPKQPKPSFFQRLTGAINADIDDEERDEYQDVPAEMSWQEEVTDGELTVDVYQTPDEVVVKTIVAGVRPEDLDIAITRDMVTIKGRREEIETVSTENYFHRELYWGSFTRTIMLPAEIDVEAAEAIEKHGLLTIKLPKIDKDRQTKLKVKTQGV